MTRTHFNSSSLMRTLADLEVAGTTAAGPAFAEKLGLWVSFTDAIALSAIHSPSIDLAPPPATPGRHILDAHRPKVADDVTKTRQDLVNLITRRGKLAGGKAYIPWPEPPDAASLGAATFEPYRRFYAAHQREMEASLAPLRARARAALVPLSPALQQLATLDAALDRILRERESKLLTKVASLMQRRFMHLLRTYPSSSDASTQVAQPTPAATDSAWLTRFCQELQTVLLAELDLRLQPTLGLLEAYENEMKTTI